MLPALTIEETSEIMGKVLDQLKTISAQCLRATENIKQQLAQSGQDMDDKKILKNFILPHLETTFQQAQNTILDDFEVEEYELADAVTYYVKHGDKKLKEASDRIKLIYKEFGGDVDDDDDDEEEETVDLDVDGSAKESKSTTTKKNAAVTHDQVLEILQTIGVEMSRVTEQYVSQYVATYGAPKDRAEMETFQMQILTISERIESEVTERYGVPLLKFQKALQKNADSMQVQQMIMKLQELNILCMQQNGIDFAKYM